MAYAEIADLFVYGLREEARADIPDATLTANLGAASDMVDGYLVGRYGPGSMPLLAWGTEITMWTAWIAVYLLMSGPRGYSSESGIDPIIETRYRDAKEMLARTQRQDYHPIITPRSAQGTTATQPYVQSWSVINLATGGIGATRGW
jgi:phage gp36-like protein